MPTMLKYSAFPNVRNMNMPKLYLVCFARDEKDLVKLRLKRILVFTWLLKKRYDFGVAITNLDEML